MTDSRGDGVRTLNRRVVFTAIIVLVTALAAVVIVWTHPWSRRANPGTTPAASPSSSPVPVLKIAPGRCFVAPSPARAEIEELAEVACDQPHTLEAYALVLYTALEGADPSIYPGAEAVENFAKAHCAQEFRTYIGVSYRDSTLFYTYLLPTARAWRPDADANAERNVVCFVTTDGTLLRSSVKGTRQ